MHRSPAPTIDDHIQDELLSMTPRVFMIWNPIYQSRKRYDGYKVFEPRWEIWCELQPSRHKDASNEKAKGDKWNSQHQCWMRRLQVYETSEGEFAHADRALIKGLQLADAWTRDDFYEDTIENPHKNLERLQHRARKEIFAGGAEYYHSYDRTLVGPDVNSGWRWRIR